MDFTRVPPEFSRKLLQARRIKSNELLEVLRERALALDMDTRALVFELAKRFEELREEYMRVAMAETKSMIDAAFSQTTDLGEFQKVEEK